MTLNGTNLFEVIHSSFVDPTFLKEYSISPTGSLEFSVSVGMKGLYPVILTL
jgi:hypothetical protein